MMFEGFKEQYELYELWMDTFAKSALEGSKSGDIPSILNKYWLESMDRFNSLFSMKPFTPESLEPTLEPGDQIYKRFEEIHNYWVETTTKMFEEVLNSPAYGNLLAQSINSSMDTRKMLQNMFTQNLKTLGIPTKNDLEEIREGLNDINTQISEIRQDIKALGKKK
jgi:hypothetical protein